MTNFSFINNPTLQKNLVIAEEHIVDLTLLSESIQYKRKRILLSSLRKTIIVLTASTIEALLLWKLKETCKSKKLQMDDDWKYFDIKILHQFSKSEEIIAGRRKKERRVIDKLDFVRITDLCVKYKIIKSLKLRSDIDRVRELRNRLHIGGLNRIEKGYRKADLEFCFKVSNKVRVLVAK